MRSSRRLPVFALEEWFRRFAFEEAMVNLSPSNPRSPSLTQLCELAGTSPGALGEVSLDYGETAGAPALRAAIAGLYCDLDPGSVVVTSGALEAITLSLACLVGTGDVVVLETPIYGAYRPLLERLGAQVVPLGLEGAASYEHRLEALKETLAGHHPLLAVVNPFNNPTGRGLCSDDALLGVAERCAAHGCRLLSDEVFRFLGLDGTGMASVLDLVPGRSGGSSGDARDGAAPIALGDMTKAWGLGGLRIGWVACRDPDLLAAVLDARDYTTNSSSTLSEAVATMALSVRDQLLAAPLAAARTARDDLDRRIATTGGALAWQPPRGGYCGWVEVPSAAPGEVARACEVLATERHLLLLPGAVFGPAGDRHVRVGLAAGADAIWQGLEGLLEVLGSPPHAPGPLGG